MRTRQQRRNGALLAVAIVWAICAAFGLVFAIAIGIVWLFDRGYYWQGWLATITGISAFFALMGYFCEE